MLTRSPGLNAGRFRLVYSLNYLIFIFQTVIFYIVTNVSGLRPICEQVVPGELNIVKDTRTLASFTVPDCGAFCGMHCVLSPKSSLFVVQPKQTAEQPTPNSAPPPNMKYVHFPLSKPTSHTHRHKLQRVRLISRKRLRARTRGLQEEPFGHRRS